MNFVHIYACSVPWLQWIYFWTVFNHVNKQNQMEFSFDVISLILAESIFFHVNYYFRFISVRIDMVREMVHVCCYCQFGIYYLRQREWRFPLISNRTTVTTGDLSCRPFSRYLGLTWPWTWVQCQSFFLWYWTYGPGLYLGVYSSYWIKSVTNQISFFEECILTLFYVFNDVCMYIYR